MDIIADTSWHETPKSGAYQALSPRAGVAFSEDLSLRKYSNTTDKDQPIRVAKQIRLKSSPTYLTIDLRSDALPFRTIQRTVGDVKMHESLGETSSSDRVESIYSVWTRFFFHTFLILFVSGIGVVTAGSLWGLPLVTAFGPLVLGVAVACLWHCMRRASQEHGF